MMRGSREHFPLSCDHVGIALTREAARLVAREMGEDPTADDTDDVVVEVFLECRDELARELAECERAKE